MIGPLTYLDALVIAICFISGLLAMYRGLSRELLSILSWLVAGIAVLYFYFTQEEIAADVARQMGTKLQIAQIAISAIIFLIVLILVHILTSRLSDAVLDSSVGLIDRILGFGFGVIRGFLLIVIPFMMVDWFLFSSHYLENRPTPTVEIPQWVEKAKTVDTIASTGRSITGFLQQHILPVFDDVTSPTPANPDQTAP